MKIRRDYVTNSSSSSYIVAFKGFPKIDEDTTKKYPFIAQYEKIAKRMIMGNDNDNYYCGTTPTEVAENIVDLRELLAENYGYDPCEFDEMIVEYEYISDIYEKAKDKLNKGYNILFKNVAYGDIRNDFFKSMESDDFIILSDENE